MNALIIHGTGSGPDGNWFPWLRQHLAAAGFQVFVPQFTKPELQSPQRWFDILDREVPVLDEQTIVLGHSVGALFLIHILERLLTPIRASVFVAGFAEELGIPDLDSVLAPFLQRKFDWNRVRANAGTKLVYAGDDDPYVPRVVSEDFAKNLGTPLTVIPNGKHLNRDAGFTQFPELLRDLELALNLR